MSYGGRNGVRRIKWCVRIWRRGWRANNCTGNRTRALTTSEVNAQQLITPEAVEAIPEIEFDQTANLTAEAEDYQRTSPVDADAEPIPELEFDQTSGW